MEAVPARLRPNASTENDVQTPILCRPGGTAFILPSTKMRTFPYQLPSQRGIGIASSPL
jgi:hypothetical protein